MMSEIKRSNEEVKQPESPFKVESLSYQVQFDRENSELTVVDNQGNQSSYEKISEKWENYFVSGDQVYIIKTGGDIVELGKHCYRSRHVIPGYISVRDESGEGMVLYNLQTGDRVDLSMLSENLLAKVKNDEAIPLGELGDSKDIAVYDLKLKKTTIYDSRNGRVKRSIGEHVGDLLRTNSGRIDNQGNIIYENDGKIFCNGRELKSNKSDDVLVSGGNSAVLGDVDDNSITLTDKEGNSQNIVQNNDHLINRIFSGRYSTAGDLIVIAQEKYDNDRKTYPTGVFKLENGTFIRDIRFEGNCDGDLMCVDKYIVLRQMISNDPNFKDDLIIDGVHYPVDGEVQSVNVDDDGKIIVDLIDENGTVKQQTITVGETKEYLEKQGAWEKKQEEIDAINSLIALVGVDNMREFFDKGGLERTQELENANNTLKEEKESLEEQNQQVLQDLEATKGNLSLANSRAEEAEKKVKQLEGKLEAVKQLLTSGIQQKVGLGMFSGGEEKVTFTPEQVQQMKELLK